MYDVVIIGSGPAGYTAAIYTSRAFLKTLILTGPQVGGQLTTTTEVENFPGFQEGIQGPELLQNMKVQAEKFGTEVKIETVKNIKIQMPNAKSSEEKSKDVKIFQVETENGTYETRSIIVATGAQAKPLGIPSEETFRGKGISYCATCDGFFFRGKNIAVLGGGDTAMEEATFLTRFADHVTIIHRREEFRASPIMVEKAKKDPKISFLLNKEVVEFYGDTVLKGIKVRNNETQPSHKASTFTGVSADKSAGEAGKIEDVAFDGVFIAIGHTPATAFLKGMVAMDEKGYILIKGLRSPTDSHTATSVDGMFAAGDCVDMRYRQGIVAAGMGAMAALDVERWLTEKSE